MAYVFSKAQKSSSFQVNSSPGPGDYNPIQKPAPEHAAPFNCSSFKTSVFDVDPSHQTGPGSYNPPCQKQLHNDKSMRMTSSFSSKVQRFKTEPTQPTQQKKQIQVKPLNDTPYRYNPSKSDKILQKQLYNQVIERVKEKVAILQQTNRKRKSQSIGGNRQFVRIVLSNPKNTEVLHSVFIDSSITKKQNGPGSYNIDNVNNLGKATHVVDWSRNTIQRFKSHKNKNPGPGSYTFDQKVQRINTSQSAAFSFQGLRSHIDEVIYRTKMPFKVKVIEEKKLKDRYPGPGSYDPHKVSSKSFHYGQDRFGSTQYQSQQQLKIFPGPGYYQIAQSTDKNEGYKERLKKNREKIFGKTRIKAEKVQTLCDLNKEEVRKQCLIEIQRTANKFYSLEERCSSKIGDFSHADRWKYVNKNQGPGPGQYKVQTQPNEQKIIKSIQCGFNSAAQERSSFLSQSFNIPFYEVDRNDMGKRALRARKNIENLKQIEIEKAPFNSKVKRFIFETKNDNRSPDGIPPQKINKQHYEIRQSKIEMMKKMSNHPQLTSQFKSKTKRSWIVPSNELGPGDYNCISFIQKKSFNQDYNYHPPVKIRSTYRTRSSVA